MRLVFFGTPDVAVPSLETLAAADDVELVAVVTNPDRPRGRSGTPQPPPVKVAAERLGIEVWQPTRPGEVADRLAALDLDAGAVVAYGAILPPSVLAACGRGLVNLHFSLLPRWRGAAPVQHAILAGDTTTGVTTFVIDEGLDTGPILEQEPVEIGPEETAGELTDRLARIGAPVLLRSLRRWLSGELKPTPQPTAGVTHAPRISPEDVRIDWAAPAGRVAALVRAANPKPGAFTTVEGRRLKVWRARVHPGDVDGTPGTLVGEDPAGPLIACGEGAVVLIEVQPEGGRRMEGSAWLRGHHPRRLGT